MATVGRITQDGQYKTSGRINTRSRAFVKAPIFTLPFDQDLSKSDHALSNAKVLGFYSNASHPTYDYIAARCDSITLSSDITLENTATVVSTYDLVIVDQYVWAVSSAIMNKLKEFVDAGISVIAIGNDTRTNVFVKAYTAVARVSHTVNVDEYGRLDIDATTFAGSSDVFGGIDELQNGAIPEYYRADTNQIMAYTYTSPTSGAVLFFDQEGFSNTIGVLAGIDVALQTTRSRQTNTNLFLTAQGLGISNGTTNLYDDGDYATQTLHPVRNGTWTFPNDIRGPDGQQVIRVDADGTSSYHGRDITVTVGITYTASVLCYVSTDNDSTLIELQGEQGFGYTQPTCQYDLTKKGTWQKLYMTGSATTTNARILAYDIGAANTGFVLFADMQFEQTNFPTPFVEGSTSSSLFTQSFKPQFPCSILGRFKPLSSFDDSGIAGADYSNTSANQSTLIGIHDNVNGSNAYYRFYQNVTTGTSSPFLDPDGAWGTSHRHVSYELTTDEIYYLITLDTNLLSINIYQNGAWKGAHNHTFDSGTITAAIDEISMTKNGPRWNGYHSNVSVYDTVLSTTEATKIIGSTHNVTAANTYAKNIQTKPYIPGDVNFFSLGANGGDNIENTIIPHQDSTNYTDGDAYVGGGNGKLQYNLNDSIGLDWNGDWSICYMKKPIGTHTGEASLTGYGIESLGSNSNSVGGGYIWWGKNNGSNSLANTTNSAFTPADFFNNWQYITLVKSGTGLTIETWLIDRVTRTRTGTYTSIASNYFVNQYGYDLYLGGWDDNGGCYTHFKNLLVAKRALTTTELNNFRLNKLKAFKDVIFLQAGAETNATL